MRLPPATVLFSCALAAASGLCSAGCAHQTPYYLDNNAAGALNCPQEAVTSSWSEDTRDSGQRKRVFASSGCGRTVYFTCDRRGKGSGTTGDCRYDGARSGDVDPDK